MTTAVLIAGLLSTTGVAAAAGPVDQVQDAVPAGNLGIFDTPDVSRRVAQTFTAGVGGTLDQVDLQLALVGAPGPLTVQIRGVDAGGQPSATVLASATLPAASISADTAACPLGCWVSVPLPPSASTAGTSYAIVASVGATTGADEVQWAFGGSYAGGEGLLSGDRGATWDAAGVDLGFRTFVTPAAVPPPPPPPPPPPVTNDCRQQGHRWWPGNDRRRGCREHHWHWRDHGWHDED